ncbi:arsenite export protein [Pontibacter sp. BAB1700]|nr:arsenite export protein [Pontibacter sp. BAB1700]
MWTPLLAYLLGYVFLSHQHALWIGFVMLMVTPCTD